MASRLVSSCRSSDVGPGWDHCAVFLDKTLFYHGASLHPGLYEIKWILANLIVRVTLRWTTCSILSGGGGGNGGGSSNIPSCIILQKPA